MSSGGFSSAEIQQMLAIRRSMPEAHLKPYDPTRTVAPQDVFGDYDEIMASQKGENGNPFAFDNTMKEAEHLVKHKAHKAPGKHRTSQLKNRGVGRCSDSGPAGSSGGRRGRKKKYKVT